MIKKIKVTKLRPGMFVHDFNCSWFKHPFLRGKAKISDQRMIDKIVQHGIKEVYIDTSKGLDVRESDLGKGLIREIQAQLSAARYGQQPTSSPIASSEKLVFDDTPPEAYLEEPELVDQTLQAVQEDLPEAQTEDAPKTSDEPSPATQTTSEVPPEVPDEAPVEYKEKPPQEAPVEAMAEAPVEVQQETAVETQAEAATETQEESPVEVQPEATAEAQPEAAAEAQEEAAAEAQTEAHVEAQPEAAEEAHEEAPVEDQPEAAAETQEEPPVEVQPETPVDAQAEAAAGSLEEPPVEAHAQATVEPEHGDNGQVPEAAASSADTTPSVEPSTREAQAKDAQTPAQAEAPNVPENAPSSPEDAPSDGREAPAPKSRRRLAPRVTLSEPPQAEGDNGRGAAPRQVQAQETASSDDRSEMPDDLGVGSTMPKTAALEEEMEDAARIRSEAKQIVQKVLEDAKLGKQIQMEKVYPMVGKIVDSVLRNPDALLTLSTIKKADDFTYMHSLSVCVLMTCLASSFHLSRDNVVQAGIGALLHDVGKVKVPPEILHKAGKLTEEEEAKLRTHVEHGYNILSKSRNVSPIVLEIATQHHEHHEGTGYPRGLKGDEISIFGQAAAVVNMYDILTSDRWWRKGMEPTEALSKILGWSKFRFNEDMVHRFIRCVGIYPIGTLVRMESGLLGVVVEQGSKDLLHPVVRTIYDTKRQWFTKPRDIDLSNSMGKSLSDRIVCHESPDKWKIKPQAYLAGEMQENGSLSRRLRGVALNA